MRELFEEVIVPIAMMMLALLAFFIVFAWPVYAWTCHSKWDDSGFVTDYGPIQGCRISRDGKTWIPEDRYREIAD